MSNHKGPSKYKPGTNVDFTPVIPKFLQGRMRPSAQPRRDDDSDGDEAKPTFLDLPEGTERPNLEDEAPTIVADDDILALLAKQEVVVADGKLERKSPGTIDAKDGKDENVVEFGKRSRPRKAALSSGSHSSESVKSTTSDINTKKRPSETDPESGNPTKRPEKKKLLSFDDEEDL
jgi:hypothetical protein